MLRSKLMCLLLLPGLISCDLVRGNKGSGHAAVEAQPDEVLAEAAFQQAVVNEDPYAGISVPSDGIFITDGYFRFDDFSQCEFIKAAFEPYDFHALMKVGEQYRIVPVEISFEFGENECTGFPQASIISDKGDYTLLISGLVRYNEDDFYNALAYGAQELVPFREYTHVFVDTQRIYEDDPERSLVFYAESDGDPDDEDFDPYASGGYKLFISENSSAGQYRQQLLEIENLEHTMPVVTFIGDIDGDGLPDFILDHGYNYEFHHISLFLTSLAGADEFVGLAAESSEWRDC